MQDLGLSAELGLWDVIRGSKGYLVPTALPLTLDVAGATQKWGVGLGYPSQLSDSPTCRVAFLGLTLKRVLRAENSHTDSFGTGSLGCA